MIQTPRIGNPLRMPKFVKMTALAVIAPVVVGGAIAFSGGPPQASADYMAGGCLFMFMEGPGSTITTIAFCDNGSTYVF